MGELRPRVRPSRKTSTLEAVAWLHRGLSSPTTSHNQPRPGFPFLHRTSAQFSDRKRKNRNRAEEDSPKAANAAAATAASGGRRNELSPGRPGSSAGSASAKLPSRLPPLLPPPPAAAVPLQLPPPPRPPSAPSVSAGARGGMARALPPPSVHVRESFTRACRGRTEGTESRPAVSLSRYLLFRRPPSVTAGRIPYAPVPLVLRFALRRSPFSFWPVLPF